jgi:hypothetical protein
LHRRPTLAALISGAAAVTLASLCLTLPAGASTPLRSAVSQTPVSWTPNVFAGPPPSGQSTGCNTGFFGSGQFSCQSEVYSTAYVNGDVIVSGAFTEACQPGPLKSSTPLCKSGTEVTRDDIFAYTAGTGVIDPNFVPVLNAGPAWSVLAGPAGTRTVYVGGAFSAVDGATHKGLVQLNVNPNVTTGATADGSVVTAFKGGVNNQVRDLALSPNNGALYVGGQFTAVDGVNSFTDGAAVGGLARLSSTTGALDSSFAFTLGDPISGLPSKIDAMTLSPDGSHLAFSDSDLQVNGQSRPRLAIVDTGVTLGASSSLSDWTAPALANNCSAEHDYVRGLDFSPNGSFIVTANTGYQSDGSTPGTNVCDSVARFDVNTANTTSSGTAVPVAPSWVDYAGGDSFYSVAIAGGVVYAGGHDRWVNNYCGDNAVCEPNAELVDGLSALDANTGVGIAWWHPLTLRGAGTMYLSTFPANTYDGTKAGLAIGTDVDNVGGAYHSKEAIFPLAAATSATPAGPIPSGVFVEEGGTNTATPMCIDDAGDSSASGAPVELSTCLNELEQSWSIEANDTIRLNGLCLDTAGATATGSPVGLVTCAKASTTQQWTQGPGNTVENTGASSADNVPVCLTDPGASTTNGTQLQIQDCAATTTTSQVWPLPSAQGPPAGPATGPLYPQEQQPKTSNDPSASQVPCLDDAHNSVAAGNAVQLEQCTGDTEQRWTIEPSGTIQIDGNYCLDSSDSAQTGSVPVALNPCNGTASQDWTVGTNFELVNTGATSLNGTPYCLDDPAFNSANGTNVQLYSCNGGNNQAWRLPGL